MNKILFFLGILLLAGSIIYFYTEYQKNIAQSHIQLANATIKNNLPIFTVTLDETSSHSNLYPPTNIKAQPTDNGIELSWNFDKKNLLPDKVENINYVQHSGFRIYRDGYWYRDIPAVSNTFTDDLVYPGDTYTYAVASMTFDNKIEGERTSTVSGQAKVKPVEYTPISIKNASTYLAIGDSITQGLRAVPGNGWVDQFTRYLKKSNPQIKVINQGVTGLTTQDLIKTSASQVTTAQPDVVTIEIGINDLITGFDNQLHGFKMGYVSDNLDKIIKDSQAPNRTVLVLNIPYQNCCKKQWNEEPDKRIAWNKMIRDTALKNKIKVIDVYTPMKEAGDAKSISEDFLHPSQGGHDIIAQALINALKNEKETDNK